MSTHIPLRNDQQILIELLTDNAPFLKNDHLVYNLELHTYFDSLQISELAYFYAELGFLHSFLVFLKDQSWLQKNTKQTFKEFVTPFLKVEFLTMSFLHPFFESSSHAHINRFKEKIQTIENVLLEIIKSKKATDQKEFLKYSLDFISDYFDFEDQLSQEKIKQGKILSLTLYRRYDSLDQILNLDYKADHLIKYQIHKTERLYEGSGVGVQSGYSTLLMALKHLSPSKDSRIVDLGSGYGRFGFVVGLLRPDIDFIGYEFIKHRVDIALQSTKNLTLEEHVHFYAQDLSNKDFIIPDAEIYYLYDPFCEETYKHVLAQLVEISKRQKIKIATKGNAKQWLVQIAQDQGWGLAQDFDGGNLSLFYSV